MEPNRLWSAVLDPAALAGVQGANAPSEPAVDVASRQTAADPSPSGWWQRHVDYWRRLWAVLQAENVPRLVSLFVLVLLAGGAAIYFIERGSNEQFKTP